MAHAKINGFTLIELSIVLVIIGLIIGGVLVGRDLISAAKVRSQISQIEKYNTAAHTFQLKYNNYLPGDIPDPLATSLGLTPRGTDVGEGDGNGIIQGPWGAGHGDGVNIECGETALFWDDLSAAKLIGGSFTGASATVCPGPTLAPAEYGTYYPQAAIGQGNYVYATSLSNGNNYFGIEPITGFGWGGLPNAAAGLTVAQAFAIDSKIDDGQPMTGRVLDIALGQGLGWAGFPGSGYVPPGDVSGITGSVNSADNCIYKEGPMSEFQYSINFNNGSGMNCDLMIQFQ